MSLFLKTLIKASNQQILLPFYHLVSDKNPVFIKHLYSPKNVLNFTEDLDIFLKNYHPISLEELILIQNGKKSISKPCFHLTFDDGLSNFYDVIAPILIEKNIPATVFLNTNFVDNKEVFYRYKVSLLIEYFLNAHDKLKNVYFDFVFEKTEINVKRIARTNNDVMGFLLKINFQNKELLDELANKVNYSFPDFLTQQKPYLSLLQIKELQEKGFTFGAHSTLSLIHI